VIWQPEQEEEGDLYRRASTCGGWGGVNQDVMINAPHVVMVAVKA
jgi:hypothetical protein